MKRKFIVLFLCIALIVLGCYIYINKDSIKTTYQQIVYARNLHDNIEKARVTIKKYMDEKFNGDLKIGKVDKSNSGRFYNVEIYPVEKKYDDFYYDAEVKLKVNSFDYEIYDTYWKVINKEKTKKYFQPKLKELFGNDILFEMTPKLVSFEPGRRSYDYDFPLVDFLNGEKSISDNNRIETDLHIYVFDLIENEQEKEKYREKIYALVNYMKDIDLFKYIEIGVFFIDKRFLAPDYKNYMDYLNVCPTVGKEVGDEIIYIPAEKSRRIVSEKLQKQIDEFSLEELSVKIQTLDRHWLNYEDMRMHNEQYYCMIRSKGMLSSQHPVIYNRLKEDNELDKCDYDNISEINIYKNSRYIYVNRE